MAFNMKKKSFSLFLLLILFASCSQRTYIPEEIYYTVEDNAKVAKREQTKAKKDKQKQDIQVADPSHKTYLDEKTVNAIIDEAKKYIGTPYKWGGTTPEAFDCSGFVSYVFKQFGIQFSGNAVSIADQVEKIEQNRIKKGDLVFFKSSDIKKNDIGHVALVIEVSGSDFKMIHATSSKGVIINDFLQYEYWKTRYLFAGRVKK
jgi:cell wall-associated NlpC family hydrolase